MTYVSLLLWSSRSSEISIPYYIVTFLFQLTAVQPTSKIVLHAQDFTISEKKIALTGASDSPVVSGVALNTTFNLLTLDLDKELQKDENYTLTIPFYGNLKMGLDGVYISSFANKNSKAKE